MSSLANRPDQFHIVSWGGWVKLGLLNPTRRDVLIVFEELPPWMNMDFALGL